MSSLEWNKIFAAILVAGITAKLAGFVADHVIHPSHPKEAVIAIDTSAIDTPATQGALGPAPVEPILGLLASADIGRGEKISRACRACHTFDPNGPNLVGPNLYNIVGADLGHVDEFAYSDALLDKAADIPRWTYEALNKLLRKPKDFIPSTKMNYIGLKKAQDRADLIAWMRTLSDNPKDLPTEIEIEEILSSGMKGATDSDTEEEPSEGIEKALDVPEAPDTVDP